MALDRRLYATGRERAATGRSARAAARQTSYCRMDEQGPHEVAWAHEAHEMSTATLDKWLTRLAIVGALAAIAAGTLFWLVLTQPVALAGVLDRIF